MDSFSITSLGEEFDRDDRLSHNLNGHRLYGSDVRDSGSGSGSDVRAAAKAAAKGDAKGDAQAAAETGAKGDAKGEATGKAEAKAAVEAVEASTKVTLESCDGSHHGLSDPGSLDETGEPLQDYLVVRMGGNPWCTGRARHLTCFKRSRRPFKVAILCPSNGSPSHAPSNVALQQDTQPPSFASSSSSSSSPFSSLSSSPLPSSSSSSPFPFSSSSPHCAIDTNKGSQSVCATEDNAVQKEPCERDCLNCSPGCQNHYINNHLCDSVCFRSNCAFDNHDCAWAFDDARR